MAVVIPENVREMFPDLKILSSEETSELSPTELNRYLEKLKQVEGDITYKEASMKAKIESLESSQKVILDKIKEEFGVTSIEELETLRTHEIKKLDTLLEELKEVFEGVKV